MGKKKSTKKTAVKFDPETTDWADKNQFPTIKSAIYRLFDELGYGNVGNDLAERVAKLVKPDTAWKLSHLYYWRKVYKRIKPAS